MAHKLKCWVEGFKHIPAKNVWRNKSGKESVHVTKHHIQRDKYEAFVLKLTKRNTMVPQQLGLVSSENEGVELAQSYMKKHDRC